MSLTSREIRVQGLFGSLMLIQNFLTLAPNSQKQSVTVFPYDFLGRLRSFLLFFSGLSNGTDFYSNDSIY